MNNASTGSSRTKIVKLLIAVVIIIGLFVLTRPKAETPGNTVNPPASKAATGFNKDAHSTTKASSLWVVVNKKHPLQPKDYVPPLTVPNVTLKASSSAENMHLSPVAAAGLTSLFQAAKKNGYNLMLSSGYRSYAYQIRVYSSILDSKGETQADKESAKPGYSEHQTGLAADIAPASGTCDLAQCFGDTPEGKWVAANAYKYGFIVRYPANKVQITGYEYEPWHLRYVGTDLSTEMHKQGVETLEEFFNVGGGTSYN